METANIASVNDLASVEISFQLWIFSFVTYTCYKF